MRTSFKLCFLNCLCSIKLEFYDFETSNIMWEKRTPNEYAPNYSSSLKIYTWKFVKGLRGSWEYSHENAGYKNWIKKACTWQISCNMNPFTFPLILFMTTFVCLCTSETVFNAIPLFWSTFLFVFYLSHFCCG